MKKLFFVLFTIVLIGSIQAKSQDQSLAKFSVGAGYFGELFTHPGITVFGNYALNQSNGTSFFFVPGVALRYGRAIKLESEKNIIPSVGVHVSSNIHLTMLYFFIQHLIYQ